jgi:hypothetical protein
MTTVRLESAWDVQPKTTTEAQPVIPTKAPPTVSVEAMTSSIDLFEEAMHQSPLQKGHFLHSEGFGFTSFMTGTLGVLFGGALAVTGVGIPLGIAIAGAGIAPGVIQGSGLTLEHLSKKRIQHKGGTTSALVYPQEVAKFIKKQNALTNPFERMVLASFAERLAGDLRSQFETGSIRFIEDNFVRVRADSPLSLTEQGEAIAIGDLMAAIVHAQRDPQFNYAEAVSNAFQRISPEMRDQVRPVLNELDKLAGKNQEPISELIWNTLPPPRPQATQQHTNE